MASPSKKISVVLTSIRQESASGHYYINYNDLQKVVSQELVENSIESFYQPEHRRTTAVREVLEKGLRVSWHIFSSTMSWMRDYRWKKVRCAVSMSISANDFGMKYNGSTYRTRSNDPSITSFYMTE